MKIPAAEVPKFRSGYIRMKTDRTTTCLDVIIRRLLRTIFIIFQRNLCIMHVTLMYHVLKGFVEKKRDFSQSIQYIPSHLFIEFILLLQFMQQSLQMNVKK